MSAVDLLTTAANQILETASHRRMQNHSERASTFDEGWPHRNLTAEEMASAGFFYTHVGDRVQCAFCHGIVSKWEPGDSPIQEHCRHFPLCPFLVELGLSRANQGYDDYSRYSHPENGHGRNRAPTTKNTNLEELGVTIHQGPKNSSQATKEARLRSFSNWPENAALPAERLAEAGFFYIGISDHTKCFYCDGGLRDWQSTDDPWEEHALWFQNCSFLRLNKGDLFIKGVLSKHNRSLTNGPNQSSTSMSADERKLDKQVEEFMSSDLVNSVISKHSFPAYMVKGALKHQLKQHGVMFQTEDELITVIRSIQEDLMNVNLKEEALNKPINGVKPLQNGFVTRAPEEISLEEQNRMLKDQYLCKICMDSEVGVVFLPCGHLVTCPGCAPALADCPLCRQPIKGTVRTFLS